MYGGEESLPSAALIGLMRSRVNRRTNECMPLCPGTDAQKVIISAVDVTLVFVQVKCSYYHILFFLTLVFLLRAHELVLV